MFARPVRQPSTVLPLLLGALALLAGCLPEDAPVKGRLLYPGIGIEHPEFMPIGEELWVLFELRQRPMVLGGMGGALSVHLVNWHDPSQHRMLMPSRAERGEWPRLRDAEAAFFYMVDERRPETGPRQWVGTLQRVLIDGRVIESIDDVMSYGMLPGAQRFYYRKHRADANHPELHIRDLSGQDRNLGLLTGSVQFLGAADRVYYITGDDQTLTRVDGFTGEPQKLRSRVSQFLLGPGEKFAILRVLDEGRQRTLILELPSGVEKKLPLDNPSNWLELRGETFVFSEPAREGQPAELHFYDIANAQDRKYVLPDGVPSVGSLMGRPPEYRDALIFDSRSMITVFRPEQQADRQFETTGLRPSAPAFTPDGRYLLFLEPEPPPPPPAITKYPTGKLFAQSTEDWSLAPRQLSPKGASVPIAPVGYRQRPDQPMFPLLFWARFGLGGSDLYLSNYETGAFVKVAEGIGAVSVGERHVLGVVRLSQDLTGDLVFRDFVDGREQMVETGVADMSMFYHPMLGDLVAFVVRERRVESRRNGLWATTLVPLPAPDPETMAPAPRLVSGKGSVFGARPEGVTLVRPE